MAGIDKILDAIKSESDINCEQITKLAKEEANKILEEAKTNIEKENQRFKNQTESMAKLLRDRGVSTSESEKSKMLLKKKQEIIESTINMTKDKIRNFDDKRYFEMIEKLILENAHKTDGIMVLSEKDYKRIPSDFIANLNNKLQDSNKGKLDIAEPTSEISDGVMLKYGEIQENLSIDSIFTGKKEMLEDKINASLFG